MNHGAMRRRALPADRNARPFLPTEIEHPCPPAEGARPFLPTEIETSLPAGACRTRVPADVHQARGVPAVACPSPRQAGRPVGPGRAGRSGTRAHEVRSRGSRPPANWRHAYGRAHLAHRPRGRATPATAPMARASQRGAHRDPAGGQRRVLYLRFHHAPFHVTGVTITQRTPNGCGVDVTGQISTNGAAGTVSYQWLFQPDREAPQQLSKSVAAGQNAVYVTVARAGQRPRQRVPHGHPAGPRPRFPDRLDLGGPALLTNARTPARGPKRLPQVRGRGTVDRSSFFASM